MYSLGSEINYNWVNDDTGELLRGRKGLTHQEKNWGNSFPPAWIRAEGVDGPSGSSFAVSLGVLGIDTFNIPAHLIGYRSSAATLNFKPTNSVLTKFIDGCSGRMNATVTGLSHKLEFETHRLCKHVSLDQPLMASLLSVLKATLHLALSMSIS